MKKLVISYSMTGNNDGLAKSIAADLGAEHIKITEPKKRTNGKIAMDVILNRTPKINESIDDLDKYGLIIFVGPVWMGQVASPLRMCFKDLKDDIKHYAFISISGGALGPNPKLADDLTKRIGKKSAAVIDLHIADLLPSDPKPTRQDTSAYRLNEQDIQNLTGKAMKEIHKIKLE
jgi:flavodoxin